MNLELNSNQKIAVKIKEHSLLCSFTSYTHELHGGNAQLNTIVDLLINLGENLLKSQTQININIEEINKQKSKNLDYIKEQNNLILSKLSESISNSSIVKLEQRLEKFQPK